jgi:hypothetical protein
MCSSSAIVSAALSVVRMTMDTRGLGPGYSGGISRQEFPAPRSLQFLTLAFSPVCDFWGKVKKDFLGQG